MWPPYSVPASRYYIALYLQDSRAPSPYSWGVFDIQINGETFYRQLNVTTSGAMVFRARKRVVEGKSGDLGGRRSIEKKKR